MQKTRQKIIEYLKENGNATVDELCQALDDLTAVTVRHHLDVLRGDGLVSPPEVQHRDSPGRPKYVYHLTEKAEALFPKNFITLTQSVLGEIGQSLDPEQVNVLFDGIASRMAAGFDPGPEDETFEQRLNRVVDHLSEHGYEATWDTNASGYVLQTSNCPYAGVAGENEDLCVLDMRYLSHLLGCVPRRLTHMHDGEAACSYLIPFSVQAEHN